MRKLEKCTYTGKNTMEKCTTSMVLGMEKCILLKNVMENEDYAIPQALVLNNSNHLSTKGTISYLPIYMTMFIHKQPHPETQIYHLELSGL